MDAIVVHMETNGWSTQEIREAVAAELRAARARARITRPKLVELTGVSKSAIERLENGSRDMDIPQLVALTSALGTNPVEFMDAVYRALGKQ